VSHNNNPKSKRLQKILSEAGVASRREAEGIIRAGRVRVNGVVVTALGTKADPERDRITVDESPLRTIGKKVYYLFHKPENVMVTRRDPQGRPTIFDFLKGIPERVNYVGRLDFNSEGLLFLTNDGELHARLIHPRHEVPKIYQVKISGRLTAEELKRLIAGIDIGGYVTQSCEAKIFKENPHNCWVEIRLTEGKNRQVRRMIEALDHQVLRLVRVGIGPLKLVEIKKGEWRPLKPSEIAAIQALGHHTRP
jgi:23S rRNA pseudouridine2605 synthase